MASSISLPTVSDLWNGFLHLLYPDLCVACGADVSTKHACFCLQCRMKLPVSDMYHHQDNEFTERFWGRLPIQNGAALYYFTRKSPVQRALHQLKYHNKPDIGIKIGRDFGRLLHTCPLYQSVDAIIPVPLHPRKERMRGYNQSTLFAQGLAEAMGIPVLHTTLVRAAFTATQTRKKRMDRFQNVAEVFAVHRPGRIEGLHLLLVDDVLTTGATLEICGQALLEVPNTRLSMATIAIAVH